ncbi:MAG: hypothetical protein ACD_28C00004G0008 [uncultured bacterium]|nr:MAG: hypothetical protein ACD_28C00004G0008 [uncultured bacterium]KKT76405.1 MAG: Histidine-tRNA ligase [Candidatus Peregrinibacteria bacterium GW2011_GWA2_44_7]
MNASEKPTLITPEILKGTRDFLPKDMAKREYVMDKIRSVFVRFGYDTIETPAIEYTRTLLGNYGEEGSKLMYRFKDNGDRDIALRYDQTVPFARLVAANYQNLPMPFKRYQISRVWRADKPAKGRYREFYQCDIDVIGTASLLAEAEVAAVMFRVFEALGFPRFVIKFNSRRLMNSIMDDLGIEAGIQKNVIRSLDKLDKIGREGVKKEMMSFLEEARCDLVFDVVLQEGTNAEKLKALSRYSTEEIQLFLEKAAAFGVPEGVLEFDVSLARGLDYYTGITFEAFLPDVAIGAVCAGGRYDDLCSLFCKEKFSGVGVAFGFDRLVVAMEQLELLKNAQLNAQILVTYFDDATLPNSLTILRNLQADGLNAEVYFEPASLSKQMKYADKKEIPFVVICGPDELAKEEVMIKIMKTGQQKSIPQNQLTSYFKGYVFS